MARSSGRSSSYREWEAERRRQQRAMEQAAKQKEQQRTATELGGLMSFRQSSLW